MENTLLFVGTTLLAFQFVGDIGYLGTLFSAPLGIIIRPLMKRLGLGYEIRKVTFMNLELRVPIGRFTEKIRKPLITTIALWILFFLAMILFGLVTLVTQPIMIAYFIIGRPLISMNQLLNIIYEKFFLQWSDFYIVGLRNTIEFNKKYLGIKTKKEKYSDRELLDIRKKKGELPFLAYFGLMSILAGFMLQVT